MTADGRIDRHHRRTDLRHRSAHLVLAALLAMTATAVVTGAAGVAGATSPAPLGGHLPLQRAVAPEPSASPSGPSMTDPATTGDATTDDSTDAAAPPLRTRTADASLDAAAGLWAGASPRTGSDATTADTTTTTGAVGGASSESSAPSTSSPEVPPHTEVAPGTTSEITPDVAAHVGSRVALPASIEIPDVEVTSDLVPLGLDADRRLEVPGRPDVAGWYAGGPRPGEPGAAVIVGHVDWTDGPAVFWPIPHLEAGDPIVVTAVDGTTTEFVVDRVERWPKAEFPTDLVYRDADGPELRLVTCGGVFDDDVRSYRDNIIVFAHRGAPA
jgi:sortase (surface protein transpeptidase)